MDSFTSTFFWIVLVLVLVWLAILIYAFIQLFNRNDLSLIAKIFWAFILLSFPVIGLIVYLVIRKRL